MISINGEAITQSTPVAKDIVLILDRSGSMRHDGRLNALKTAANTLIITLNSRRDHVAIVTFNNDVQVLNFTNNFTYA
jgi:Mg-chelatase subunit ChlD